MNLSSSTSDFSERLAELESYLKAYWEGLLARSPFIQRIFSGPVDKRLYALYMIETFHYTRHNARNQALVGAIGRGISPAYMKFCFDHAAEETGHEFMALKDLQSLGVDRGRVEGSVPLPETEALIAYLYWVSLTGNPVGRLGYSFWAEAVYEHINAVVQKIRTDLNLLPKHMTFFIAHSDIDQHHADEVREVMRGALKTEDDWQAVRQVMERSLYFTEKLLEGVDRAYVRLIEGQDETYAFLNDMPEKH